MLQMIIVTFNYIPIYTYADILIIMQSYKIDIIVFEVCRYYLLHIIYKGTQHMWFCRSVTPP